MLLAVEDDPIELLVGVVVEESEVSDMPKLEPAVFLEVDDELVGVVDDPEELLAVVDVSVKIVLELA